MRLLHLAGFVIAGAILASAVVPWQATGAVSSGNIARGEYIVRRVSMCIECHGMALRGGQVDQGPGRAAIPTPPLAGLPMFPNPQLAVQFLKTGFLPSGGHAPPPMPAFRLDDADARDVVAYLRSLK